MGKTAYVAARIEPNLKRQAEAVLDRLGVNTTAAITMFYRQVVLHKGMPFDVRLPNAETAQTRDPSKRKRMPAATIADTAVGAILGKPPKRRPA